MDSVASFRRAKPVTRLWIQKKPEIFPDKSAVIGSKNMDTTILKDFMKAGSKRTGLILSFFLALGSLAFAESSAIESKGKGAYLALPAYVFGDFSTLGLQGGYQFKKMNLRFDLNMVNHWKTDGTSRFIMPSVGLFSSRDWQPGIRVYQGINVGAEIGIRNSFDGQVYFINYIVGAELLSFGKSAFFLEVGPGMDIMPKEGAFNGGTVIGGGLRRFF